MLLAMQIESRASLTRMPARIFAAAAMSALCLLPGAALAGGTETPCVGPGVWLDPARPEPISHRDVLARAMANRIALLGESHGNAEHHRWQLHVIAALHALAGEIVLGFEMFPRRVQPILDRWVAGKVDERTFLAETDWDRVWGFDAALYMPLFRFARMHKVPMVALNVDRDLVRRVREGGWESVPAAAREGISAPAPPSDAYVGWLREVYRAHLRENGEPAEGEIDRDDPGFRGFVAAQLTWDRAMAEALFAAAGAPGRPLVIGVIGSGHLRNRFGVPRQLAALGLDGVAVLLPWDQGMDCAELTPDFADAVFGLAAPAAAPPRALLGVLIAAGDGGVKVRVVLKDSVAESAGVRAGDVIVEAAGRAVARPAELIAVVKRQAPGTWLPLRLVRDGEALDIVAKFPAGE